MSTNSINQKRIALVAVLGILLLIVASCVSPTTNEAIPGIGSGNADTADSSTSSSSNVESDDDTAQDSGNAPGNVDTTEANDADVVESSANTEETASDDNEVTANSDTSLTYKGLPVGYTEEGFVYRGSPDAPITIYEYSDYQCPFCQRHFYQTEPALDEQYVADGIVRFVFVDFPLTQIHPNAPAAHSAALCVADQDPVAFWEMHGLIFETQGDWGSAADPVAGLIALAEQLDIDMDLFNSCLDGGTKEPIIAAAVSEAQQLGFGGTPSFNFVMEETGDAYSLVATP